MFSPRPLYFSFQAQTQQKLRGRAALKAWQPVPVTYFRHCPTSLGGLTVVYSLTKNDKNPSTGISPSSFHTVFLFTTYHFDNILFKCRGRKQPFCAESPLLWASVINGTVLPQLLDQTIRWIVIKFFTGIHGHQKMNHTDFGDSLTFPLVPPLG